MHYGIITSGDSGDPALRGKLIIGLRDYIALDTQRGPDPNKLLTPRILTFKRPWSVERGYL